MFNIQIYSELLILTHKINYSRNIIATNIQQMIQDIENQTSNQQISCTIKTTSKLRYKKNQPASVSDFLSSAQIVNGIKQCRICLDDIESPQNILISPCKCTGSVKYVHNDCFRKWVERQYTTKSKKDQLQLLKNGVSCQLCKQKVNLICNYKYVCCHQNKFSQKFEQNPATFYLFFLFILIDLACISYLAYYAINNPLNFGQQILSALITIVAFIFLGCTQIAAIYFFIGDYIIDKIWVLEGFQMKKSIKQQLSESRNRIIPTSLIQNIQ